MKTYIVEIPSHLMLDLELAVDAARKRHEKELDAATLESDIKYQSAKKWRLELLNTLLRQAVIKPPIQDVDVIDRLRKGIA